MLENYDINNLNPKKNPYVSDEKGEDMKSEYDFGDATKNPYVSNSGNNLNPETLAAIAEVEYMKEHPEKYKSYDNVDELFEDALKEEDMEIPPSLISNLIEWLRNKGISDKDIVDCMLYICKGNEK